MPWTIVQSMRLTSTIVLLTTLFCVALALSAAVAAAKPQARSNTAGWEWSSSARTWSARTTVLPSTLARTNPNKSVSRLQFVNALAKLENQQARGRKATRRLTSTARKAPGIPGAPAGSHRARAIELGWIKPIKGRFAPTKSITADDAAVAMAGVLGLQSEVTTLSKQLRALFPDARFNPRYAAAHALNRNLGLRYNVLQPYDKNELSGSEPVNVAHAAYMLHASQNISSWQLDKARTLANDFDLPELSNTQRDVLTEAVQLLGQPYVWAGESEFMQPEGHGGFDCSGFVVRVINGSGFAPSSVKTIAERTSMDQSAVPRSQRIRRANLKPGDVMFFGNRGTRSTPSQNYHAGIYMGNGWFIHSSGGNAGVAIDSLTDYWAREFSWARRQITG